MTSKKNQNLLPDGDDRSRHSAEALKLRRRIAAEVRERHRTELERAGWLRRTILELRILREISVRFEKAKPPAGALWVKPLG